MLVLARELGAKIRIGDDIIIEVVRLGYHRVYLGITAPKEVPVHREEIFEAIQRSKPANNEVQ